MAASEPSATPPAPRPIAGLAALAERYDAFLVDQWGCIHDGIAPFPAALDALARLNAAGKQVIVLSNAPRRSDAVARRLAQLGVPPALFAALLSSGEMAWQALARRDDPWHARLGRKVFHVGPDRDLGMMDGNGLTQVRALADAELLLATGPCEDRLQVADHAELLGRALARRLPMVCANPDHDVLRGEVRLICAGALADWYAEHGGDVRQHGKPYPSVYAEALRLAGVADTARVLAVGDGMRTDIAGAQAAGIASAFIPGGIHGAELGAKMGELAPAAAVTALARRFGCLPTYLLPALRW